jgi:hypothetical protein
VVPLTEPSYPVDFYAGVIATCAVVLFAKFVTHHVGKQSKYRRPWWGYIPLWIAHVICVAAALVGLAASLAILAQIPRAQEWDTGTGRCIGRWGVLMAALISGLLLALDVAIFGHIPRQKNSQGDVAGDPQRPTVC